MKIALCTETYLPILNGVVTFVSLLATELRSRGHEVLIVAASHNAKRNYIEDGVLYTPAIKSERLLVDVASPIDRIRYHLLRSFAPDVIHIQNEWGIGLFGLHAARLLRVPVVYTLHSEYDKFYTYAVKRFMIPFAAATMKRLERHIVRRTHVVTSPSYKAQHYFDSIGLDVEVEVIENAVDLATFDYSQFTSEDQQQLRSKLNLAADLRCALFVGRMGPEKSVDILLNYWAETVARHDRLQLLLIGGGPDDAKLKQQAHKLGIAEMVSFIGKVPHAEIASYFALADLYVTASISEMHSMSMLEALAFGLPVLQRIDPPNRSQIQEGVNGWIFETHEEFGRSIHYLRSLDQRALKQLKENVRASIVNRNSPQVLADNYYRMYERSIERFVEERSVMVENNLW